MDHPLLAKVVAQFAEQGVKHERIRAIDDEVVYKAKVQRWRGAVWSDADIPWLIAAGQRSEGSPDDFYADLETRAKAARSRYNAEHTPPLRTDTYIGEFLPDRLDLVRYQAEAGIRFRSTLVNAIFSLVRASLNDGHEHVIEFDTFTLGVLVRADQGHETYAAVHITGSVPPNLTAVVLRNMPGCDPDGWFLEMTLPTRTLLPGEQVWSTVMDPTAAAELLHHEG
ncbi:hypothetical protein ACTWPT_07015 [Nonomuraea sp. 3N208]|uniref:hypothetical protein n=1 Tax=Nonomuraea sp. 3N208 TaxID=3457421 RepID=UPI003FCC8B71